MTTGPSVETCWNIGIPYKRAYALSSYALIYVALIDVHTCVRSLFDGTLPHAAIHIDTSLTVSGYGANTCWETVIIWLCYCNNMVTAMLTVIMWLRCEHVLRTCELRNEGRTCFVTVVLLVASLNHLYQHDSSFSSLSSISPWRFLHAYFLRFRMTDSVLERLIAQGRSWHAVVSVAVYVGFETGMNE